MLWLVWHMWILIGLAFAGGVIAGWVVRGRSDDKPVRPMLETLDATVVAPVETPAPKPIADLKPAAAAPAAQAKAKANIEPAPAPTPDPKPAPASKAEPKPAPASKAEPKPKPAKPTPAAKPAASKPKSPKPKAADPAPPPPVEAPADDLTKIKGLGPKAAAALNGEGVTRFDQVAAWSKADVDRFDALINGRGRIERDDWVKQAKALANA